MLMQALDDETLPRKKTKKPRPAKDAGAEEAGTYK